MDFPVIKFFLSKLCPPALKWWQRYKNKRAPISKRLNEAIALLRESKTNSERFSDTKIAEAMGLEKLSDLTRLLNGTDEPRFKQLEEFSDKFGINSEWLKHGETPIFLLGDTPLYTDDDFLSEIKSYNPHKVYFVREDAPEAQVAIVLDLGNNTYVTYSDAVNLSSHVGGTGRSQLHKFHHFVKDILDSPNLSAIGRTIDKDKFQKLSWGEIYAGTVVRCRYDKTQHWWDDFIFLYANDDRKQDFIEKYGESFVNAQDIVREEQHKKAA